jgi:cytochrome c oxidase subunit IV
VITRYVLLRGGIIAAVLMYALRDRIGFFPIYEVTIPVLVLAVGIVGFQEWNNCEKAFASPLANHGEEKDD